MPESPESDDSTRTLTTRHKELCNTQDCPMLQNNRLLLARRGTIFCQSHLNYNCPIHTYLIALVLSPPSFLRREGSLRSSGPWDGFWSTSLLCFLFSALVFALCGPWYLANANTILHESGRILSAEDNIIALPDVVFITLLSIISSSQNQCMFNIFCCISHWRCVAQLAI